MSAALELAELSHRYPNSRAWAIADLSLRAAPGETLALLGPSGCGKTTILKIVAGLLRPTQGQVGIDGRPMAGVAPEARPIAMVFQQPLLFPHLSVADNVAFGPRMRGLGKRARRAQAAEALAQVRIPHLADRRPSALSGGEQSRVALARALVTRPALLLLDEPLSALDPTLREDMHALLARLRRQYSHTALFVTHDQLEAVRLADRIALILDGRLQMIGAPRDFYERPASRRVAEFFGAGNFIEARVGDDGVLHTAAGGLRVAVRPARANRAATATIRPEALQRQAGENSVSAHVVDAVYMGTRTRYRLDIAGMTLAADWPPDSGVAIGETISVRLPPDKLWVLPEA